MKRLLPFIAALITSAATAQTVPNGGITQGQVWSTPQWIAAWQAKADVFTAGTSIGSIPQFINFDGGGHPGLGLSDGLRFRRFTPSPTDTADVFILRNPTFSGGSSSNVNNALNVSTTTVAGITSFEWTATFKMDNFGTSADGSQNVALYAQAFKESSGHTWAATAELRDFTADPAPGSAVTEEFDFFANGTDAGSGRVILDVVGGKRPGGSGVTPNITYGMRIGPQFNTNANANFVNPLYIYGSAQSAIGTAIAGINISGTPTLWLDNSTGLTNGINLNGSYSGNAIQSTGFSVSSVGGISGTTLTATTEILAPVGCSTGYNFSAHTTSGMCFNTGLVLLQNGGVTGITLGTVGQVILASGPLISAGTTFTVASGTGACATTSTLVGGAIAGSFKCTGTAGASTATLTLPQSTNGYACFASDATSGVAWAGATVSNVSAKLTGTIATTSDVVNFGCIGY